MQHGYRAAFLLFYVEGGFLGRLGCLLAVLFGIQPGLLHKGAVKSALTFKAAIPRDLSYAFIVGEQ